MAQTSPQGGSSPDDLTAHSLEWVADTLDRWIEQNETAQRIQGGLPYYVHERLSLLPPGHDALPMAMALSMPPATITEAYEWLRSAKAQVSLVASLSHPSPILDAKRGDEKTGQEVGEAEGRDRELEELRREVALLRETLSRHLDRCPGARRLLEGGRPRL